MGKNLLLVIVSNLFNKVVFESSYNDIKSWYKDIYSYRLSNKERIMSYNTADNTAVLLLGCQQSGFKTTTRHPDIGDTCDDIGAIREV